MSHRPMQETSATSTRCPAVALPQGRDALVRALQPAGQVVADVQRRPASAARCGSADRTRSAPRSRTAAAGRRGPAPPVPRAAASRAAPGSRSAPGSGSARGTCPPAPRRQAPGLGLRHHRSPVRAWLPTRGTLPRPPRRPARSIRTAQNLNSGILPNGSISSIVSRLAAASRKWNGMKQLPRASRCETRTSSTIVPRRELTRAMLAVGQAKLRPRRRGARTPRPAG